MVGLSSEQLPGYRALAAGGGLGERAAAARKLLAPCVLCPRECGVDRLGGETGFCRGGVRAKLSSAGPHFGEEEPLVGRGGSGTIFLAHCNLRCLFCQNYDISHLGYGREVSAPELAKAMLELQAIGCHNINFVTPTHYMPQLLEALEYAVEEGLTLPIVWNCGGYESPAALELLDGVVDIYLPDMKYSEAEVSAELAQAPDYPERMFAAVAEMYRQVGDLEEDEQGIARRGLLVRHLVLPEGLAGTAKIAEFLAQLSPRTYVNIMGQYHPCYQAHQHAALGRPVTAAEYREAVRLAREAGLERLDERAPFWL